MAKKVYQPPVQSTAGIIFDSLLMLVLVFCALKAPAWTAEWRASHQPAAEAAASTEEAAPVVTWEELGQNAAMQAGWEKLGKDPAAAKAIIDNKFDYSIDAGKLLLVGGLLAFYFWYMLSVSAREYRDVIAERFDGIEANNGVNRQTRAQQR